MGGKKIESFLGMYPKINTKKSYRSAIYDFLDFFNKARVRAGKKVSKNERVEYEALCQNYFAEKRDYIGDLIGFVGSMNGRPPATLQLKVAGVREWFLYNDVELTQREVKTLRHKLPSAKGSWTVENDFDIEVLKKIIAHMDEKGRSLIITLASSGMRIGEALKIKLPDVDLSKAPPEIIVRGEYTKSGGTRIVFISTEAKATIEAWLKVRESYIRSSINRNKGLIAKAEAKPKMEKDDRLFPFSDAVVRELWSRALTKAGLNQKDNSTGRLQYRIHGLRKFARSQLALACPLDIVEAILGHEGYLTAAYRRYSRKQMSEYYLKGEHHVTITGSGDIKEIHDKLQDTQATVEGYKSIITKQAEEMVEIQKEVGRIQEMEDKISAMEARVEAQTPYDDKMTELMTRLLANPEMKELIKKEWKEIK